jgi:Zn-dependent protease with chaperone function
VTESIAANPWRARAFSRFAAIELAAAAIACAGALFFPLGPLLALAFWEIGPLVALVIAAAWVASGLIVVVPTISEPVVTWLVGARTPTPDELARLGPAWDDVCRASAIDPHSFVLRVLPCPPPSPEVPWYVNACAAGSNVVGVTEDALVLLEDGELASLLAHELGHHAGFDAVPRGVAAWYLGLLEALLRPLAPFAGIWLRAIYVPILFVMALTSRPCEFAADAFAARLGYGSQLRQLLLRLGANDAASLTAAILASHPATADRVRRLDAARFRASATT